MTISVAELVEYYRMTYRERMQDLPIVNSRLEVEAVGFKRREGRNLGVLITPWFMNLVLLPRTAEFDGMAQGSLVDGQFPSGPCELTVCRDEELGTYLAAVLFRTVADFPDQDTARAIAEEALAGILTEPEAQRPKIKRRNLFTGLRAS